MSEFSESKTGIADYNIKNEDLEEYCGAEALKDSPKTAE